MTLKTVSIQKPPIKNRSYLHFRPTLYQYQSSFSFSFYHDEFFYCQYIKKWISPLLSGIFTASHSSFYYSNIRQTALQSIILFYKTKMGKKIMRKGKKPNEDETILYDRITKIETDILAKIQKLKRLPKFTFCEHLKFQIPQPPQYDPHSNYFDQYWKLFLRNEIGKGQISKIQEQIAYLSKRLSQIDSLFQKHRQEVQPYLKYPRRSRSNQESRVQCSICGRFQSDQQTLILHQKIKHSNLQGGSLKKQERDEIYEEEENSENSS